MKAIVNGKLILKDRVLDGYALLYTDVIEGFVPADKVPADANLIDAKGGYVAPGLIDLHIHGYLARTYATEKPNPFVPSQAASSKTVLPASFLPL